MSIKVYITAVEMPYDPSQNLVLLLSSIHNQSPRTIASKGCLITSFGI